MTEQQSNLLSVMDQMKDLSALLTGVKQDLMEKGWSEPVAEQIVLHSLTGGAK